MTIAGIFYLRRESHLEDVVKGNIKHPPVFRLPEGKREQRENKDSYSVVIMMTEDGSPLEGQVYNNVRFVLRSTDGVCIPHYDPPKHDDRLLMLLPGGKFIVNEDEESREGFEAKIKEAVETRVPLRFFYSNYNLGLCVTHPEGYSISPEGFSKIVYTLFSDLVTKNLS